MKYQNTYDKVKEFLRAFLYIGVGKSLFLWFLAISFVPLATVSFINYLSAYLGTGVVANKAIETSSQLRVDNINHYFNTIHQFLEYQSESARTITFIDALNKSYVNSGQTLGDFTQSESWHEFDKLYLDYYNPARFDNLYQDYYIIDINGSILYTYQQKADLGTSLTEGPYSHSVLGNLIRKVRKDKTICFSDFAKYEPSGGMISGFFAKPITDQNGTITAFIAIEVNSNRLNHILREKASFGESGEAYIIGDDLRLRTSSRFESEQNILSTKIEVSKHPAFSWQEFAQYKDDPEYLITQDLKMAEIQIYVNNRGDYVIGIYRHLKALDQYGLNWALFEEISHDEAYAYAKQLSDIAKISFIITIIIVFILALIITNRFVGPIKRLSAWAKQVAVGELVKKEVRAPKNEVGEMVDTFNYLVKSLKNYADVSQSAAIGDLSKNVVIRSDEDLLGTSMNAMIESFKSVVSQAKLIGEGDYSTYIKPRSEKDMLGMALQDMTRTLHINSKQNKDQDWLKTGINKLESLLSGQNDIDKLSQEVILFLVEYLQGAIGLLYLANREKDLELKATYAFVAEEDKYKTIKFGNGLPGQVAKSKTKQIINMKADNLPEVNYGVQSKVPDQFLIAPFIFEGVVLGVIQIGSDQVFTKLHQSFIDEALDRIAIAINATQSRQRVEMLLKQTQEQARELVVQQEELRQANEELEEQTKALKLSEESLKHQQEELRVTNEELEQRTTDLEIQRDNIRRKNDELKIAQEEIEHKAKDLEAASRYKSEFLANMSHELRTPLNSILVLSQLLAENKRNHLDEKEIEFSKTINSSGSDLLDLINEILDLSKVEAGKIELNIEESYLEDLRDINLKTFKPLADKKKLNFNVEISTDLPEKVKLDLQRVNQVLKNLLSNAIKFTQQGTVSLKIHKPDKNIRFKSKHLNPDNTIAFAVSDTGIGIPQNKLESIFEAFQQADGTTSRKYGGTGLGLTISKSFAELMQGEIQLESKVGVGTTFTLFIPIDPVVQEEVEPIVGEVKRDIKGKPAAKKVTINVPPKALKEIQDDRADIQKDDSIILIIEDDINFCRVLYELAHDKGFKCLIALDGESGLHYADYYNPHAIILDIGLPGIDGYEVIKRLKDDSKTRHIPVHIISAEDKSIEALKLGAIGYLTKPVSNDSLDEAFKKIENIISKPIKKILVVEDEEIMRKSITKLLGDNNIAITAVESGAKAFELLDKEHFEVLILDLGLGDMSGFKVLEDIRKSKKVKDMPVIIYTGKELSEEEDAKLQKYADSIILKGARSFERLLSETTLFLHQVESEMPDDMRKMLNVMHNKESILVEKKVLLVDDDMRNVFALSSVLEENGMEVVVGKTGKEGLERLSENSDIDLVLMDIMMPEMDGYTAMQEIRKMKKYANLPIIALTAKAMKDDREKCIAAGANDYLAKPVNTDKLLSLLRVWLYK